ncbi:Hypothetical predicted protein [Mytilus galloprovincialis]|uniref:Uncharacterized protein n=1 Tax=Mytilus galloprovincialis TaxID=29158 RepID=A0A8B6FEJ8_MYTGA|nr:Hypothetical predicted protein [Mytilus galloprovincialis]
MESTKSCPSNNISVERVFGQLDAELKRAPHCSLRTVESKLLYKNNKTAEWLKEKKSRKKITYWDSTMPENTGEVYCLKLAEILEDVDDGTFSFNGKVSCYHFYNKQT